MEHKGTIKIETPRLLLRPLTTKDAQAAYNNWTSDPAVTQFLTWTPHESAAGTEQLFSEWEGQY